MCIHFLHTPSGTPQLCEFQITSHSSHGSGTDSSTASLASQILIWNKHKRDCRKAESWRSEAALKTKMDVWCTFLSVFCQLYRIYIRTPDQIFCRITLSDSFVFVVCETLTFMFFSNTECYGVKCTYSLLECFLSISFKTWSGTLMSWAFSALLQHTHTNTQKEEGRWFVSLLMVCCKLCPLTHTCCTSSRSMISFSSSSSFHPFNICFSWVSTSSIRLLCGEWGQHT